MHSSSWIPPLPDYIHRPEAPPLPDYIPGAKYPEYLSPADDVLPAEEQLLVAAVSPTAESSGYITDSEPKMEPEEEDGDDETSEGNPIDYPTSRRDDDADNDGDDLSEDDADDEDEEESSDSEEEEEEQLASTVLLHLCIVPSLLLRILIRQNPLRKARLQLHHHHLHIVLLLGYLFDHIYLCHSVKSQRASMVLMRSAAPSTFILAPRSRTPSIGTPPLLPIPLPTTSFPLPLLLPSTSCSENIALRKRARFTTPTGGYEVGESSVATAARHIRPALTVDDSRRAEERKAIFSHLIEALQRDVSTLQGQQNDDEDRLTRHIQHEHAQRDVAPEDGDS
nr:hypothetical protein [Tanacetum cinerariifolium]